MGQVRDDLEARDSRMQEYLDQVRSIQEKFEVFDLSHVPRSGNTHADSLATLATSSALEKDVLPEEKSEADKVQRKAPRFWLSKDKKLYKHSFSGPYLLCVHPEASESLLEELHEGVCGRSEERRVGKECA